MFHSTIVLLAVIVFALPTSTSSLLKRKKALFQFPRIKFIGNTVDNNSPKSRIDRGEADKLRQSLEEHCGLFLNETNRSNGIKGTLSSSLRWEPDLRDSYEVANVIFDEIAKVAREKYNHNPDEKNIDSQLTLQKIISCPSMSRPSDLEAVAKVLQSDKCKLLLGLEGASAELYPDSPSPYLQLSFSIPGNHRGLDQMESVINQTTFESALAHAATKNWVDNFLGKYNLCPYTSSVTKAAVGLTTVKVPVGKVHIAVGSINEPSFFKSRHDYDVLRAAELASSFWSETVLLLHSSETDWATSLVVFAEYDDDFEAFYDACDSIIQPIIEATSSTDYIGRAWFHPKYDADQVGHSTVVPGHAVPHKMVQQFIQTIQGPESMKRNELSFSDLVYANNKVRRTPHATINILRRSQLNAASQYEQGLGEQKPKPNSIYVRNTLKLIGLQKENEKKRAKCNPNKQ